MACSKMVASTVPAQVVKLTIVRVLYLVKSSLDAQHLALQLVAVSVQETVLSVLMAAVHALLVRIPPMYACAHIVGAIV